MAVFETHSGLFRTKGIPNYVQFIPTIFRHMCNLSVLCQRKKHTYAT